MAHVKKGHLTPSPEWWRHLRPFGKKKFWGAERKAAQIAAVNLALEEAVCLLSDVPGDAKIHKREKKRFGMEYRMREEHWDGFVSEFMRESRDWRVYYSWYETEKARNQAIENMNNKKFYGQQSSLYEYRPYER